MNARGRYGRHAFHGHEAPTYGRGGRGGYGYTPYVIGADTGIEPRFAATRRAVKTIFYLHDRFPAPFYVYSEVNGLVDAIALHTMEEATALAVAIGQRPGDVYAAVFDRADASWPDPVRVVYHAAVSDRLAVAGWTDWAKIALLGPLGAPFGAAGTAYQLAQAAPSIKRDFSPEENKDAFDAANAEVAPLIAQRMELRKQWAPDKRLSSDQMTTIAKAALTAAHECEQRLLAMIDKVPADWETHLRNDLSILRSALADAPRFEGLVAQVKTPTVVPDFRAWIDHLLSCVEDGTTTIAVISHLIPSWLFARDLLTALHRAAIAVIQGVVAVVDGAVTIVKNLPSIGKYLLIGGGAIGAALLIGALAKRKS